MKNEIFEYFTTDNSSGKKSNAKWLENNNNKLYNDIIKWCDKYEQLKNIEFKRKVYHFINEDSKIPVCITCGNIVNYRRIKDGYSKYCSDKCVKNSSEYKTKWLSSWKKNNSNNESISKRIETCIEKYGSIENFKKVRLEILIKSSNEKYGVDHYILTDEFKEQRKQSLINKYGDENWNNKEKTRNTRIQNGTQIDELQIDSYLNYKKVVVNRTTTVYRNNIDEINPLKLERGKKQHHIDHKFSIKQGFINNIPVEIISHPCNLYMIWYMENLEKQDRCDITLEKLIENIKNYNNENIIKHYSINKLYQKDNMLKLIENLNNKKL